MKVLEKFQNKKVFALYLVGVLILSAGVSFAYFSANSSVTGGGSVATAVTATIESDGVQADGNISFSNSDIYPGHMAVASIRVTGTGENEPIIFNVIFNGTNTFTTPINYTIYKTDVNIDASYACTKKEESMGISKIYYEECTGNNIEELGTAIGSGTITQGEGKTILKSDEIILTEPDGKEIYYYVVFEYPNEEANQNDDIGSTIKGNITIEEGSEYQQPDILITGATTSGNNGWVKGATLTSSITTQTGQYDVAYCVTTGSSCTPNTTPTINDNQFSVTLSNNANEQRMCVRVEDEYNQIKEGCSEGYQVDNGVPTGNVTIASSSAGSNGWYKAVTIKASGSDSHSGVESIKYCTTTSTTCRPTTSVSGSSTEVKLNSNARAQRVCANTTDKAGNISNTTCSSGYSVDTTNPTISITSTSVTKNSISVTVRGSDSHSGIYQYKFSSNGGSTYTTVSSTSSSYTYTFNNLNGGTTYNIAVQAVDRSGRVSSTATRSVTTEPLTAAETILAGRTVQTRTFPITTSTTVTGTNGYGDIYRAEDDDGTTYYFAGNPTTNWVYFAGYYWRIIRINGDGSIRMIYNGTNVATTGEGLHIGLVVFNESDGGSVNVGLKYGTTQHGTTTNSTILKSLNTWYSNNIQNTQYEQYISTEAGFCGDREMASGYTWSATIYGSAIYYAAYDRLILNINNVNPTFKCSNNSDLYTVSSANKGNKTLTYPIGLITADEAVYAGLNQIAGIKNNYLYTGNDYWTMTPVSYYRSGSGDHATVFLIGENSMMGSTRVNLYRPYARPVINLRADVQLTGSGTATDPYIVS